MEVDGLNAPRAIEPHRGDGAEKMDGQSPAGTQHGAHDVRSADREAGDLRLASGGRSGNGGSACEAGGRSREKRA